ncbi:MAG TPA: hypothetical protein VEU47_12980 [Candidatus Cybelea sp.]|nr:hypothetical protein [Candidatus Cybelea sp.]
MSDAAEKLRKSATARWLWRRQARHGEPHADHLTRRYRREGNVNLIELRLNSLAQLFNTLDPSPFHEKDLDLAADDYIVGSVRELPLQTPLKLVVYLPREHLAQSPETELVRSIHNYFSYRMEVAQRDLRFQLRIGRISAIIGTLFLALCIGLRQVFFNEAATTLQRVLAEGLLISGWVAMWRPLQIFLYDWWPLKHRCDVYAKLAAMPVEVRPNEPNGATAIQA